MDLGWGGDWVLGMFVSRSDGVDASNRLQNLWFAPCIHQIEAGTV